ncbi:hypothetical protein BpHYR1_053103 [Brachionus plicatilis]|uniref:Uncharacterized protein n=1 Tax=Brachionus plicatilis TaxID=10195 RepID=A0A3M7R4A7_BRAPC|nr:hypothetical protein BpHYR1_053103 [Brachionus plicatilis]
MLRLTDLQKILHRGTVDCQVKKYMVSFPVHAFLIYINHANNRFKLDHENFGLKGEEIYRLT